MSNLKWKRHAGSYSADVGAHTVTICRGYDPRIGDHWAWRVWRGAAVVAGDTTTLLETAKVDAVAAVERLEVAHV